MLWTSLSSFLGHMCKLCPYKGDYTVVGLHTSSFPPKPCLALPCHQRHKGSHCSSCEQIQFSQTLWWGGSGASLFDFFLIPLCYSEVECFHMLRGYFYFFCDLSSCSLPIILLGYLSFTNWFMSFLIHLGLYFPLFEASLSTYEVF